MAESPKRTVLVKDPAGVGAVILAAGPSTRMGEPKQLLEFSGQSLLRRAASLVLESGCRPVVVVTGANAAASRESLRGLDVNVAENHDWQSGMSSSLRVGVDAIASNPKIEAVVLMLCDQLSPPRMSFSNLLGLIVKQNVPSSVELRGQLRRAGVVRRSIFHRTHRVGRRVRRETSHRKHLAKVHLSLSQKAKSTSTRQRISRDYNRNRLAVRRLLRRQRPWPCECQSCARAENPTPLLKARPRPRT